PPVRVDAKYRLRPSGDSIGQPSWASGTLKGTLATGPHSPGACFAWAAPAVATTSAMPSRQVRTWRRARKAPAPIAATATTVAAPTAASPQSNPPSVWTSTTRTGTVLDMPGAFRRPVNARQQAVASSQGRRFGVSVAQGGPHDR